MRATPLSYLYATSNGNGTYIGDRTLEVWSASVAVTAPLFHYEYLATSLGVEGARSESQVDSWLPSDTRGKQTTLAIHGSTFAGSPEMGRLGLSYVWASDFDDRELLGLGVSSTRFFGGWTVGVGYDFTYLAIDMPADPDIRINSHEISGFVSHYPADTLRLDLGLSWQASDNSNSYPFEATKTLGGALGFVWLPPIGVTRYAVISVFASIERVTEEVEMVSDDTRGQYSAGASLTIFFPGVHSLLELDREY